MAPYDRPRLSKGLWKGKDVETIWRETTALAGTTLHLRTTAVRIDGGQQQVADSGNKLYSYEKLLLAAGGSPRRLQFGEASIIYFRTIDDYQRLRAIGGDAKRFAVSEALHWVGNRSRPRDEWQPGRDVFSRSRGWGARISS